MPEQYVSGKMYLLMYIVLHIWQMAFPSDSSNFPLASTHERDTTSYMSYCHDCGQPLHVVSTCFYAGNSCLTHNFFSSFPTIIFFFRFYLLLLIICV